MNTDQAAKLFGISQQSVRELARRGIIARVGKEFPDAETVRRYVTHLRTIASGRGGPETAAIERAAILKLQREKLEREAAIEAGKWLSLAEVELALTTLVTTVRSGVLAIPNRIASKLPYLGRAEIAEIDDEIRAVLTEMADNAEARKFVLPDEKAHA